jgi:dTDP-4-dehydrorhamnose 3,5-epimerase
MWNDPDINVQWPMPEGMTADDLIFSEKDKVNWSYQEFLQRRKNF